MENFNEWASWKSPIEANPNDFELLHTLWAPTDEELKDLPTKTNNIDKLFHTEYQGDTPSCTGSSLTNIMNFENILDYEWERVDLSWEELRINMWHKVQKDETGDRLENALKALKVNGISWVVWIWDTEQEVNLKIDSYWFEAFGNMTYLKYRLSSGYPLYFATIWTNKLWAELTAWEAKTIVKPWQQTWWHALAIIDYDDEKQEISVMNTWANNRTNWKWSKLSIFKMSYDYFNEAIKLWQFSRRYWIVYDVDNYDESLFIDYNPPKDSEPYEAVKYCKDNWIMNWVPLSTGWVAFQPNRPPTREETAIMLYRMSNIQ